MNETLTHPHLFEELDHRESDGIEVSLLWNLGTASVSIYVFDSKTNDGFETRVAPEKALDAFHHPYAYASLSVRQPVVAQ
jgi:hypothetical protein